MTVQASGGDAAQVLGGRDIDESGPTRDGERSQLGPNHHDKGGPL
jgi:hypothetical protein